MLNHKVIEQYLTKQPRWSSDVIKALHQEALLLGAVSRSFLLFSIHFREQASAVWFHIIQTCINWISALSNATQFRCIFHSLILYYNKLQPHRSKASTVVINKCLLINLWKSKVHFDLNRREKILKTTTNQDTHFLVICSGFSQRCTRCMIMWAMCRAFSSAAWCYQKMDPPMEHFKVKAMPRLQLITFKITSLFKRQHCWTTRD